MSVPTVFGVEMVKQFQPRGQRPTWKATIGGFEFFCQGAGHSMADALIRYPGAPIIMREYAPDADAACAKLEGRVRSLLRGLDDLLALVETGGEG